VHRDGCSKRDVVRPKLYHLRSAKTNDAWETGSWYRIHENKSFSVSLVCSYQYNMCCVHVSCTVSICVPCFESDNK
jgi:hypothetical protein